MRTVVLDAATRDAYVGVRDLTDPSAGSHAMQRVVEELERAVSTFAPVRVIRGPRIVSVDDNYYDLCFPRDGGGVLDGRWVDERNILRTHTSALFPRTLRALAGEPGWEEAVLLIPGLVYRRDVIDRTHCAEPHQADVWWLRRGKLGAADLDRLVDTVVGAVLPGTRCHRRSAWAPYSTASFQVDGEFADGARTEIVEAGVATAPLLANGGLGAEFSGVGMGIGLDRVVMLRKGIDDIRLLRATHPSVCEQLLDLSPYRALDMMSPVTFELEVVVDEEAWIGELGDRTRVALGPKAASIEELALIEEGSPHEGHKRVRLRVVVRDLDRPLAVHEIDDLRHALRRALHVEAERA